MKAQVSEKDTKIKILFTCNEEKVEVAVKSFIQGVCM